MAAATMVVNGPAIERKRDIPEVKVALAGNPNCGKTSLFNFLTGSNQKVGNWGGVTVEKKEGTITSEGTAFNFVDLPGTYSLSPYSLEEVIARDYIIDGAPDSVVNVVDASNLERNLFMTVQLLELGAPVIVAMNMVDVARGRGIRIDTPELSRILGVPVVETVGRKGKGIEELKSAVREFATNGKMNAGLRIDYGEELESILADMEELILTEGATAGDLDSVEGYSAFLYHAPMLSRVVSSPDDESTGGKWRARWMALRLLAEDEALIEALEEKGVDCASFELFLSQLRSKIEDIYEDDIESVLSERVYAYVKELCQKAVNNSTRTERTATDRVDSLLTSPLMGLPVFGLLMYLMFETTFTLGAYPMEWLAALFESTGALIMATLPADSLVADLLVNGIIDGVGGVIVFLPNIVLLFLFIAVFEDSGYMARVAFLMDRLMHGIGLHGKSFISLITGFGCNVPGVMAARTLENERDRLVTILINPFMSCSARLPVYILFCGAFFPEQAGLAIFGIYMGGIAIAIISGKVLRLTVLKGESAPFVMELPPYRIPTARSLLMHMWERANLFLTKAGTIVLCGVVIMWGLNTFPREIDNLPEYDRQVSAVRAEFQLKRAGLASAGLTSQAASADLRAEEDGRIKSLEAVRHMETVRQRYGGQLGTVIEPIIAPFGFDWRVAISLIPGFAAKEIVVGSLGVLYQVGGDAEAESAGLQEALRNSDAFTPFRAVLFMIFTLLYVPCLATVATIKRETNSWRWPLFSIAYSVSVAWIVTYGVMTIGTLLGFS